MKRRAHLTGAAPIPCTRPPCPPTARALHLRMMPVTSMPMNLVILKMRVTLDGSISLSCARVGQGGRAWTRQPAKPLASPQPGPRPKRLACRGWWQRRARARAQRAPSRHARARAPPPPCTHRDLLLRHEHRAVLAPHADAGDARGAHGLERVLCRREGVHGVWPACSRANAAGPQAACRSIHACLRRQGAAFQAVAGAQGASCRSEAPHSTHQLGTGGPRG